METPNILFKVKRYTSKQGNTFSLENYKTLRTRLSELYSMPYVNRLKDVWCDNPSHHSFETIIMIDGEDKTYKIEKVCCQPYSKKIIEALVSIQNEP